MSRVTRRELLSWMAAHAASVPLIGAIGCGPPPPPEWEALALRAAGFFSPEDLEAVRVLGRNFLDAIGRDVEVLEPELAPTLTLLEAVAPADDPAMYEATITANFSMLDVRDVAGWTLAATEAHLAALIELFELTADDVDTE